MVILKKKIGAWWAKKWLIGPFFDEKKIKILNDTRRYRYKNKIGGQVATLTYNKTASTWEYPDIYHKGDREDFDNAKFSISDKDFDEIKEILNLEKSLPPPPRFQRNPRSVGGLAQVFRHVQKKTLIIIVLPARWVES